MTEITANMVKELRDRTDAPIMNCKNALVQAYGDISLAEELINKIKNEEFLGSLRLSFNVKNIETSKTELETSVDGTCPQCQSNDWKSTKMMHLTGLTHANSTTEGSGSGIGIGIGRGRGGIDITSTNYQENSLGQHQSELSRLFSPPIEPKFSETKQQLISELRLNVEAEANRLELKDSDKGWWPKNILDVYRGRIVDALTKINELDKYEKQKRIWDEARVCQRCGTQYFVKN